MNPSETQAWVDLTLSSQGIFYKDAQGRERLPGGQVQIRKLSFQDMSNMQSQGVDALQRISKIIGSACRLPPPPDGATPMIPEELLLTDRMCILLNQRIISFGPAYAFTWPCPNCRQRTKQTLALNDLRERMADTLQKELGYELTEPFDVKLEDAGKTVAIRLLRGKDQADIARQSKRLRMSSTDAMDPSAAIRQALQIVTIDGQQMQHIDKESFVRKLTWADSLRIDLATEERETGYDTKVTVRCGACGQEEQADMPFDVEFFRPTRLRS